MPSKRRSRKSRSKKRSMRKSKSRRGFRMLSHDNVRRFRYGEFGQVQPEFGPITQSQSLVDSMTPGSISKIENASISQASAEKVKKLLEMKVKSDAQAREYIDKIGKCISQEDKYFNHATLRCNTIPKPYEYKACPADRPDRDPITNRCRNNARRALRESLKTGKTRKSKSRKSKSKKARRSKSKSKRILYRTKRGNRCAKGTRRSGKRSGKRCIRSRK